VTASVEVEPAIIMEAIQGYFFFHFSQEKPPLP